MQIFQKHKQYIQKAHEWQAMTGLLLALFLFIGYFQFSSKAQQSSLGQPQYLYDQNIQVTISGAVAHPGVYSFQKGAVIQDILSEASPLPEANLKRFKPQSKLRNGQVIHIPASRKKQKK